MVWVPVNGCSKRRNPQKRWNVSPGLRLESFTALANESQFFTSLLLTPAPGQCPRSFRAVKVFRMRKSLHLPRGLHATQLANHRLQPHRSMQWYPKQIGVHGRLYVSVCGRIRTGRNLIVLDDLYAANIGPFGTMVVR